ncbi:V-type ATP synthase subunit F [Sedimentibacter sp. MB31-C6]|uniref:V-type ATP synthase subunit F n=1 Tax=Sedimentibacter sp. MB31-C6 TaxID=3109366 RepID=UPI002DDCE997|nr:V-type ATP synthase subunit F [Sedimentibacter sp. MB36-C1]WSI05352.1 V-type ATP synthase subunit F [Sedimentibacter sp. MB36-C1]
MYKIGVIGDKQSIIGFQAVGLDVFYCSTKEEAKHTLNKIAKEDYAIIYITESFYSEIDDTIHEYDELRLPAIIPIPSMKEKLGIGEANIKKAVEKAVGADILFNND